MFGFSLSKILALAAILAAVWYGFKLVNRLDAARRQKQADDRVQGSGAGGGTADRREQRDSDVVDLVQDSETGAYVPRDRKDRRG